MNAKHVPFIKAILYADIFDYPLLANEVWTFMIGMSTKKDFEQFVANPPSYIKHFRGFYYLSGRKAIIEKRQQREKVGQRKLVIADVACKLLSIIPTIQFIGISGGLSLLNTDAKDDIDFFIITKKNTVWVTRLLVAMLLEVRGMRRKRNEKSVSDRICVNMYLDESQMQLSNEWRDLYVAHEVMQVVPLFNRHDTYATFNTSNKWIQRFMPNAFTYRAHQQYVNVSSESWVGYLLINAFVEHVVRFLQQWYMKRHRTREVVSDTILAFHPVNYRVNTLTEFAKKWKQYEKV